MNQQIKVSHSPESSDDEIIHSRRSHRHALPQMPQESQLIHTVKRMSDRMIELQQKIARLSRTQSRGAVSTLGATHGFSQQPTIGATNHSNTLIAQSVFDDSEEQNPWLLPRTRRSSLLEGTLINTNYNDQPLNQLSSVVSPKREPISAPTVTATNAQLQLQTDIGASQSYGTHSGLGLNQSNLSDYLVDHRTANAQLHSSTSYSSQNPNVGKPLENPYASYQILMAQVI